jgi:hypothetical protein
MVNEVFKSFEYSFVIEYYKQKTIGNKIEDKKESICVKKGSQTEEQELICALYF